MRLGSSRFKISWPGILGFVASVCGIIGNPALAEALGNPVFIGFLPQKLASVLITVGPIAQAVTRSMIAEHETGKFPGSPL